MAGPLGFEPRTSGSAGGEGDLMKNLPSEKPASTIGTVQNLEEFVKFCKVDLRQSHRSAMRNRNAVQRYLSEHGFTAGELRDFLFQFENPSTYNNWLKSFVAYGKFIGVSLGFKFARCEPKLRIPPSRKALREFYYALDTVYEQLLFLGYACTGLRRRELLDLQLRNLDQERRAVFPQHDTLTKRSYVTFYNEEFEDLLHVWLRLRNNRSDRLFPLRSSTKSFIFVVAQKKTGLGIAPQDLRFWFANEMARLGVPDRFIDAFQGRIPRSVLARHYTDYSLENLKQIYDRAGLRVLS